MRRYAPIGFAISASSNAGPRSNRLAGTGLHFVPLNSVRGAAPSLLPVARTPALTQLTPARRPNTAYTSFTTSAPTRQDAAASIAFVAPASQPMDGVGT